MALHWRSVARSDPGLVREINEDAGYASSALIAVADGMGGHAAGEVASQAAIDELVLAVDDAEDGSPPLEVLAAAIRTANARIRQLVAEDSDRSGMGTTLTALLWAGDTLAMVHVGDSRAYRLRDGVLTQITHDHTFVQSLIDEGRLTPEDAKSHPARSLILRALQGESTVQPDLALIEIAPGDRLLVCSDGLDNAGVPDSVIAEIMAGDTGLDTMADALVEVGLGGGAPDNITVVLAEILEVDGEPDTAVGAGAALPADDADGGSSGGSDDGSGDDAPGSRRGQADGVRVGAAAPVLAGVGGSAGSGGRAPAAGERHGLRASLGSGRAQRKQRPVEDDVDPEALRYAPRPPRRFLWARRLLVVVVLGAVVWAGYNLARDWLAEQYFVSAEGDEVAIFRGLDTSIGPIAVNELHDVAEGLPVEALPPLYRNQIEDSIAAEDLADAESVIASLRLQACRLHPPTTAEPTASPTPTPTSSPTSSPSPTPTPSPTPSPTLGTGPVDEPTSAATPAFPGLVCTGVGGL